MSATNIVVSSELRLDTAQFQASLTEAERMFRAWSARMSAAGISVPVSVGGQMYGGGVVSATPSAKAATYSNYYASVPASAPPSAPGATTAAAGEGTAIAAGAVVAGSGAAGAGAASTASRFGIGGRAIGLIGAGYLAARGIGAVAREVGTGIEGAELGEHGETLRQQVAKRRQLIESEHGNDLHGFFNYLYGKAGLEPTYTEEMAKLRDAEQDLDRSDARVAAAKRAGAQRKQEREQAFSQQVEVAGLTDGSFAGHRAAIANDLRKQDEAAKHIDDAWQILGFKTYQQALKVAADIRTRAGTIASYQRKQVDAAEYQAQAAAAASIRADNLAGSAALLRMSGRNREASGMEQRAAVNEHVRSLYDDVMKQTDPELKRLAYARYAAAARNAPAQIALINQQQQFELQDASNTEGFTLRDTAARARFARMRRNGTAAGEHAADLAERDYAAYAGSRRLSEAYLNSHDAEQSARISQELTAENARAAEEVAANHARELKRIRESVADFMIGKDKAELAEHENDYKLATKIFEEEWDKRLKTAQTAEEKQAMLAQKAAEKQRMEAEHTRGIRSIYREGAQDYMRAAGHDAMAEAIGEYGQIADELQKAGSDQRMRRAVAYRERGRLQLMARGQIRTGTFGSFADYMESAQSAVISGAGEIMPFLKSQYRALGDIERGKGNGDEELFGAGQALRDAADKLTNQNIFVLRDN